MYTLAHLSDLHVTRPRPAGLLELANKRLLGFFSWNQRRRHVHRPEVVTSLIADLERQAIDHIAITGDLTHIGLPSEIDEARSWLARIGSPERVTLIPGNHDAYAPLAPERSWETQWPAYLAGDAPAPPRVLRYPDHFPTLRRRGPLALIGLCSALPTAPFLATGELGAAQLSRLEVILREVGREGLCRVVLVHHRPTLGEAMRRSLLDGSRLREVISRAGAELVLHGHSHRTVYSQIGVGTHPIPVVGVRSASDGTGRRDKSAGYHLLEIEAREGGGHRIRVRERGVRGNYGEFGEVGARELA
jgi:3',5'-cyclic AMP phosphodiesterase CpdA